jgi:CheY-like chemotaxis protein
MPTKGPIVIIDDDPDDQEMIERVLKRLDPELKVKKFLDGEEALHYLQHENEQPFLILCDINMPIMNGLELKKHIEASEFLSRKSIPFVFLTTTTNMDQVRQAYHLKVQGFFSKGQTFDELKSSLHNIIHYWKASKHPNS